MGSNGYGLTVARPALSLVGQEYWGRPVVVGRTCEPCAPGLLDLPSPLLHIILSSSGSGAAPATCSGLREAFDSAMACPALAARFLMTRHGAETALYHVYGSPGVRRRLLAGVPGSAARDAAMDRLVRELLRLGAMLGVQARFLLTAAAGAGDTRVVRTLLRMGAGAGGCGGRALVAASAAGHLQTMEVLLAAGVSARAENGMALCTACRGGQLAAAQLLLRRGADPRSDGSRALSEAAAAGHVCVVLALLAAGAQAGARNGLALREAAGAGHSAVVEALRSGGAATAGAAAAAVVCASA